MCAWCAYGAAVRRLTGKKHTDLLTIASVSAAGYVPQLFSPVFPPAMICTLLARSGTDAGTWNEPLSESTNGAGLWWSNRMQLNAPYTPSLM